MKNCSLGLVLLSASMVTNAQEWAFDVYLDNNKIGKHTFELGSNNLLTSRAMFNVKVLFIDAYKYDHTAKEQWKDGCLSSLESKTIENKVTTQVKANSTAGQFKLLNPNTDTKFSDCVMTFAYWNPKILEQTKLLNPQNAEYLTITTEKLTSEPLLVKGKVIETKHYKLKGALNGKNKLNLELWYNLRNEWVGLKSITPEGYNITYKLR